MIMPRQWVYRAINHAIVAAGKNRQYVGNHEHISQWVDQYLGRPDVPPARSAEVRLLWAVYSGALAEANDAALTRGARTRRRQA